MPTEPWQMDATEQAALIRNGALSSREATLSCLERLDKVDPKLNAITLALHEQAVAQADAADKARAKGDVLGALHGVPVTTKCNTDQIGCPSDNGVVALKELTARSDNPVIANMRKAGAIFVGRTNTPAFSMRFYTENDLHGRTENPYSREHTCGGSSGGAGAAVAAGIGTIGQGNDIAGSIRWPAYCNGVVGLRPSYGRIPAFNDTAPPGRAIASQLMAVQGPLTRTVRDARLALAVMAGRDHRDNRWIDTPLEGPAPARPIKVALVRKAPGAKPDEATAGVIVEAGRRLASAGYTVEEVDPPDLELAYELWHRIGVPDVFGALEEKANQYGDHGIKRSMELWQKLRPAGTLADFRQALTDRDGLMYAWSVFFERWPIIVMPMCAGPALPHGLDTTDESSLQSLFDMAGRYLFPAPVLGLPGLSVPLGSTKGLPLGVQIIAPRYREDLCLDAGEVIEAHEGRRIPINPKW